MKVVIRADASVKIGSGHIMRTVTLADSLRSQGAEVIFISRNYSGDMNSYLERIKGYQVSRINYQLQNNSKDSGKKGFLDKGNNLEFSWHDDYLESKEKIIPFLEKNGEIDWLIVDHYSLDIRWESSVRKIAKKVMVIDDLANRPHDADILLDQNLFINSEARYEELVPSRCLKLLGPRYALLRSEFPEARKTLKKGDGRVQRVMVFYGGSDPTNETIKALKALRKMEGREFYCDIVVGASNPNRDKIYEICQSQNAINYHFNVDNMAELMSTADLFVGSGGTTTWERCCLGLPSVVTAVANNQEEISRAIAENGMGIYLGTPGGVDDELIFQTVKKLMDSPQTVREMSERSQSAVDGQGTERVVEIINSISGERG